tara:strand:- start:2280 stop:3584 length:1305 start_codon:yes stop_codon:yes gene_type:complete
MQIILLGALLVFPAFFAASEVALIRLRPSRVERLIEEGKPGAQSIHRLQRRLRRGLMVSQLGVTISLVSLGWIGQNLAQKWWSQEIITGKAFNTIFFLCIVLFATILAGLLPKALVLNRPETAALKLAPLIETVLKAMAPLLFLLEKIASFFLRLVGLNTQWDSLISALSAGELETLIESGSVTGLLPDERNILEGVFALRDTQVREVMVPRSGMVTLPRDVRFSQLMKEVHRSKHARFFVIGESLDDVLGVLDLRQLAEPISKGEMQSNTPLEPYIRPAPKVLEESTLAELLPLIKSGNPLLLVIDEHGGTEGLITAADLTGEIVGDEIQTEIEEPYLLPVDGKPDTWIADGDFEIIELNRQLKLELPEADDHHTLAGFLLEKLQRIPLAGQSLLYQETKFDIISMQGPRIDRVKIILSKRSSEEYSDEIISK